MLIGTIVNFIVIIGGSLVGLLLKGGVSEKISNTIIQGVSLCIIYIGILGVIKSSNVVLIITSMVIGGLIGEIIDIEDRIEKLGNKIQDKFKNRDVKISEGFVTASLLGI